MSLTFSSAEAKLIRFLSFLEPSTLTERSPNPLLDSPVGFGFIRLGRSSEDDDSFFFSQKRTNSLSRCCIKTPPHTMAAATNSKDEVTSSKVNQPDPRSGPALTPFSSRS